jgi:RimJ/RimL family protein N-acetyltransferase
MLDANGQPPAYCIITPRLVIRCWEPEDAPLIKDAVDVSIEHLRRWMPWAAREPEPLQAKIELLRRFRGQFDLGQDYVYGIFNRDETLALGGTGLHPRGGEGEREIGYWLRADHVNQGYATETAAYLTRVGFEIEKLRRMSIHCDVDNERSAAVARRLGYMHEATLRRRLRSGGNGFHDEMVWTLLAEEYPQSVAAGAALQAYDATGRLIAIEVGKALNP